MRMAIMEFKALDGKESEVADFLLGHAARSKELEDDCLEFQIAVNPEDPANLFIIMTYATAEAQAAHRKTDHFQHFVNECMPMLQDTPDGTKFFGRTLLDGIG
jgi:quinol monooxygenase YgiN